MDKVKERKWASALWNGDFYLIETWTGYRSSGRDPKGKQHMLEPGASLDALGTALLDALSYSRFLSLEELDEFFDYENRARTYENWVQALIERHGYKSRRALFKNMACCSIEVMVEKSEMSITPNRHEKLEAWGREKDDGIEDVIISANSSAAAVGEALRLAFSRCK